MIFLVFTERTTEEGQAMKEHTIASRIVATCCAAAVACAAAICALTTRDAVAAPTDSASGRIANTD